MRLLARSLTGICLSFLLLAVAACSSSTSAPSASNLLNKASTNFANTTALHFMLTAKNIKTGPLAVTKADGDVVRPDKLQAKGTVEALQGLQVGIRVIIANGQRYLDLGNTGKFTKTTEIPDFLIIFDANQGIGAILKQVQQPSEPTSDSANGTDCWKITGTVDSKYLAPITGSDGTTSSPVQTTLWISKSADQIVQVTLQGKAADGDTGDTIRTFILSSYNETVTITAPNA